MIELAGGVIIEQTLPKEFGDGWMTSNAADLCKVAVAFGGFDPQQLVMALHFVHPGSKTKINIHTVEKALGLIRELYKEVPSAPAL